MDWRDVWRRLFPERLIDDDLRDEIEFHIEGRVRELKNRGWSEEDALEEVLARFGDVDAVEEECARYDAQRVEGTKRRMMMEGWVRDLKLALRGLVRAPGFAATVLVTLALGIGASTAVFSVVEGILLRPLPFDESDRLAIVWQNDRATGTVRENASTSDYYDYLERNRTFEDLGLYALTTAVVTRSDADPLRMNTALVTQNLSEILRLDMQLGRGFRAEEDQPGGPTVMILTDRIWREVYGADPSMVGRAVDIEGVPYEVVGVLPADIDFPAGETDIWVPIQQSPTIATRPSHWVTVLGRLAPGASLEAAHADMVQIMADLEVEYPGDNQNRGAFVERLSDVGRGDLRLTLWVLFGAVLAVLTIAVVNVANLMLARGAARARELAVFAAIGAGASQITRKFLVEASLLAGLAALGGVALAAVGIRVLTALAPADLLLLGEPAMNLPVLGFTVGIAFFVALGIGLLPTIHARRLDLQTNLKEGRQGGAAGGTLALRRVLVAAQLSLAVVLLIGATLLIGTVRNLQGVDLGFDTESTLRVDLVIPQAYAPGGMAEYPNWPQVFQFVEQVERQTAALPGVESAALILNHSLDPGFTNSFVIEGQAYDPSQGEMTTRMVSPSYFETVGVELLEGRFFAESDRTDTPLVILLNETAARRYFPEGDAVGRRIAFWGRTFRQVVGVVRDEKVHGVGVDAPPAMYVTIRQAPPRPGKVTLMAKTSAAPLSLVEGVRGVVRSLDPAIPVFNVSTMDATLAEAMSRERFGSTVLGVFAVIAVILAVLGVHGVLSYLVAQRTHEVGVRMALGATRSDIVRNVVRQGSSMAALGIVGGLAGAIGLSRFLEGLLFGVSPTSAGAYGVVTVGLALVALAATVMPALRAASISPVESLRSE